MNGGGPVRVLVTGAAGMLGSQLLLTAPKGTQAVGTDLREAPEGFPPVALTGVDLADTAAVERVFEREGPFHGVIHAAAYTAVDRAEEEEELAYRVNAIAPRVLARAAAERDLPLVVVSTDFVFDGTKGAPYREEDPPVPIGAYGRTKRAGEEAAIEMHPDGTRIVRTQWLYGPRGAHFPGTMLRLATERDQLSVVDDQRGCPTTTLELAPALWDVLDRAPAGIWHAACEGEASWYDLAVATLELSAVEGVSVSPCTTADFPRPAPRPANSALDCSKLAALRGRPLADWRDALQTFLELENPS
jgi:dTDP-4-dehydrorhamnose reductase